MKPYLTVIIPVYNERENIRPLAGELSAVLDSMECPSEVIWVDDGSADGSFEEIKKLAATDSRMKALRFSGNFGQTAGLAAGIAASQGEFIIPMDADMQNDPNDIPLLLKKTGQGFDVVSGWRRHRKDPWLNRRLPSQLANALISAVTGVYLHDYGCTLKVYRSHFLKNIRLYGEMHRFLPAFAGQIGAKIAEMEVNHRPRSRGKSKYGILRTFKVLLDLATVKFMGQYLSKPIYIFGGWGLFLEMVAAVFAAFTLYNKFYHGIFVKDQPLFIVAIFLALVGTQIFFLGLLAEILVRTYYEINNKHPYFIKERMGIPDL